MLLGDAAVLELDEAVIGENVPPELIGPAVVMLEEP